MVTRKADKPFSQRAGNLKNKIMKRAELVASQLQASVDPNVRETTDHPGRGDDRNSGLSVAHPASVNTPKTKLMLGSPKLVITALSFLHLPLCFPSKNLKQHVASSMLWHWSPEHSG